MQAFEYSPCLFVHLKHKYETFFNGGTTYVNPIDVALQLIDGVSDQFHIALDEMRLVNGQTAQLGGAHGRKVAGMREEHAPTVWMTTNSIISAEYCGKHWWQQQLTTTTTRHTPTLTSRPASRRTWSVLSCCWPRNSEKWLPDACWFDCLAVYDFSSWNAELN